MLKYKPTSNETELMTAESIVFVKEIFIFSDTLAVKPEE
jgi:hypothetical protein